MGKKNDEGGRGKKNQHRIAEDLREQKTTRTENT